MQKETKEEKEEKKGETVVTANASGKRGLQHAHALRVIVLAGDFQSRHAIKNGSRVCTRRKKL